MTPKKSHPAGGFLFAVSHQGRPENSANRPAIQAAKTHRPEKWPL
jgi:hypothetical protein